jgi:hypothetical protein
LIIDRRMFAGNRGSRLQVAVPQPAPPGDDAERTVKAIGDGLADLGVVLNIQLHCLVLPGVARCGVARVPCFVAA